MMHSWTPSARRATSQRFTCRCRSLISDKRVTGNQDLAVTDEPGEGEDNVGFRHQKRGPNAHVFAHKVECASSA